MTLMTDESRPRTVGIVLAVSWLGILAHDLVEFGAPAPESSIAFLIIATVLFVLRWAVPRTRAAAGALILLFGLVSLLGALTSVFPLNIWPFEPEQNLRHYGVHAVWVVAQFPLLWVMVGEMRGTE